MRIPPAKTFPAFHLIAFILLLVTASGRAQIDDTNFTDFPLVSPSQTPTNGTFWLLSGFGATGFQPPLPYNPFPDLDLYSPGTNPPSWLGISSNSSSYIVDDREAESSVSTFRGFSMETSESLSPPGGDDPPSGGSDTNSYYPTSYSYPSSNALWLEITQHTNGWLGVVLHGTIPFVQYDLLSRPTLTNTSWSLEASLLGTDNQDFTFTWVSMQNRSNLFLWAKSWADNDGSGLPDWWQIQYFNHTGVDPYADPDGDGWSNLQEYQNGTNPNGWNTPPPPSGVTAKYNGSVTNLIAHWNSSGGSVTGYTMEVSLPNHFPITNFNTTQTTLAVTFPLVDTSIGAPTVRVIAHYLAGDSSWSEYSSLHSPPLFAAHIGQARQGGGFLSLLPMPQNVAGFILTPSGTPTNYYLSASSFTNGICLLPASWAQTGDFTFWTIQSQMQDGQPSDPAYDVARVQPWYDGSSQMSNNVAFLLRAAEKNGAFAYTTTDSPDGLGTRFFVGGPADYVYSGVYYDGSVEPLAPFSENYYYRNFVFASTNIGSDANLTTGPFNFYDSLYFYTPAGTFFDFSAIPNPLPELLSPSLSEWIFNWPGNSLQLNRCGITTNGSNYALQTGASNFFGLHFNSAKFAYNNNGNLQFSTLTSSGGFSVRPGVFYQDTAFPVLHTTNYYFVRPGGSQPDQDGFSVTNQTPLFITSFGESMQIAAYAKQSILNGRSDKFAYVGQYFDSALSFTNGVASGESSGVISEYGDFFPTKVGTAALLTRPDAVQGGIQGTCLVNVIKLQLDVNHDGVMDLSFGGPDNTSYLKPFTFWLNNDFDRPWKDPDDGIYYDDSVTAGQGKNIPDCNFLDSTGARVIPCQRDLQDFTRLWLCGITTNLLAALPPGSLVTLDWGDVGDPNLNNPTIDLFPAEGFDGGFAYLTNSADSQLQTVSSLYPYVGRLGPGQQIQLNASRFTNRWAGDHFIWCGVSNGAGALQLTISQGGTNMLARTSTYIQLVDIKQMYERWTIGDDPKFALKTNALPAENDLPAFTASFQYGQPTDTNTPYILFVHGWNMKLWEKDRYAESAFKRLYWQGYQGRFGGFRWPTGFGFTGWKTAITDPENYDSSEYTAWRSAKALLNKLTNLNAAYPGHVYLLAHSMGNVVAGEALRLAGTNQVLNTYVASQAAVPAHTYDASIPPYSFTLVIDFGPFTPNIYTNWLSPNSGGVGRRINFYNTNDYALSRPHWELDQLFKPDTRWLGWSYGFNGYPHTGYPNTATNRYTAGVDDAPPWNYFFKENLFGTDVYLDIVNVLTNRYEAMAYAAQSRSSALGKTAGITTFDDRLDLNVIWPPDNSTTDPNKKYSAHLWHSAQFRGDCWQEWSYWNTILRSDSKGFNIHNQ